MKGANAFHTSYGGTAPRAWAVLNGVARVAGKMYDLPYCVKLVLVDEFKLLQGYNSPHPSSMPEWYLFFAEMLKIASTKGVLAELITRIDYYARLYPRDSVTGVVEARGSPAPEEVKAERLEQQRIKHVARVKQHYHDVVCTRFGVKRKYKMNATPEEREAARQAKLKRDRENIAIRRLDANRREHDRAIIKNRLAKLRAMEDA